MADRKISDLTALTTPAAGDYLPIIDISEPLAANKNKRITIEELLRGAPNGTAGAPGIAFESDPDTGLYSTGANAVAISTGGTGRLFVDATGNVGINVASPTQARLVVASSAGANTGYFTDGTNSTIKFVHGGGGAIITTESGQYLGIGTSDAERLRITSTGQIQSAGLGSAASPALSFTTDTNTGIYSPGADQVAISTNGTGRVFIDASGNVGVGVSPAARLHIYGTYGYFQDGTYDGYFGKGNGVVVGAGASDLGISSATGAIAFGTGASLAERLRITSDGKVGLGTSSPLELLHVNNASAANTRIRLTNATTGTGLYDGLDLSCGSTGAAALIQWEQQPFQIFTNNGSAVDPRLTITAAGLVGLGTSSVSALLHLKASAPTAILETTRSFTVNRNFEFAVDQYAEGVFTVTPSTTLGGTTFTTPALAVTGTGRVGVGTSSPTNAFHVSGTNSTPAVFERTGSNGVFAGFKDASGSFVYLGNTNGVFSIQTPGSSYSDKLVVTSAGNVGVGTTSPGTTLQVQDAAGFFQASGAGISFNRTSGTANYINTGQANGLLSINAADAITFGTGTTGTPAPERARIDSSGRLLVGTSSSRTVGSPRTVQIEGTASTYSGLTITHNSATASAPVISLAKTRGSAVGSNTIVQAGDELGYITFNGADGTDANQYAAWIRAVVEGTPANDSIASRLELSTTADGASSPTERLRITSDGKVGLGTSSPYSRFTVVPGTTPTSVANANQITIGEASQDSRYRLQLGYFLDGSYKGSIQAYDFNNPAQLILNGAGGNVGVGTTSPARLFHVNGSDTTTRLTSSTATSTLEFETTGGFAYIGAKSGPNIYVETNGSERLRVDSSGRLLVGTSSARDKFFNTTYTPQLQLEGVGQQQSFFALTNSVADNGGPVIGLAKQRSGSIGGNTIVNNDDTVGQIDFFGSDGTEMVALAEITAQVDGTPGANDMPGRLVFSTTADGASSPTERLAITSDGSITTNRSFTATGSGSADGVSLRQGSVIAISRADDICAAFRRRSSDGEIVIFRRDTTQVGNISVTTTATAYNTSSDYRLKENVIAVTDGITRLQQLKPSRFNFIADPDKTVDGFIAHEVQTVVPEAITGEKDAVDDEGNPVYQGIDQSKLVPLLTAALQEAVAKIESLEARLTAAGI